MSLSIFSLSNLSRRLNLRAAAATDNIIVVADNGKVEKIRASEFNPSSLVFAHVSFDASAKSSFDGTTIAAHNVKSVSRTSEGVFVIEFTSAHPSGNYTAVCTAGEGNHTSSGRSVSIDARSTTSVTVRVERTDTGSQQDEGYIAVLVLS